MICSIILCKLSIARLPSVELPPPLRRLRFMKDFDNGGAIEEEEEAETLLVVAKSRIGFVAGFPAIILVGCGCSCN